MSRIDAIVATQAGEVTRPRQAIQESTLQAQQAQVHQPLSAPVAADDLRAIAARLQQVVEANGSRRLQFKVSDSGSTYIEILDQDSGEVIRQMPSEEALRLHERLDELIGLMIDRKA